MSLNTEAVRELVRSSEYLIQKVGRLEITANALTHALLMTTGALNARDAVRTVKADLARILANDPAADAATIAAAISENEPAESGRSLNS